jgi:hypothetical protein
VKADTDTIELLPPMKPNKIKIKHERSLHKAHAGAPSLGSRCAWTALSWYRQRVSLAVRLAHDFVVVHVEAHATVCAAEAMGMELLPSVGLEVLSLDALVASPAQRAVELMVVLCAIWCVAVDIELCCREGCLACLADEALLVVAAG